MCGADDRTGLLFSYVDLEARVRRDHPLRTIREIANWALSDLSAEFSGLSKIGRLGIAPERLLRAMLLQAFYGIRSERQLMERLEFDLSFRWFLGLGLMIRHGIIRPFRRNRDRLLADETAAKFLNAFLAQPRERRLLSNEHSRSIQKLVSTWVML